MNMRPEHRKYLKAARRNGAEIVEHAGHIKIYDDTKLLVVLSQGRKAGADMRKVDKMWRQRGWL
jgi:hypothetical protein